MRGGAGRSRAGWDGFWWDHVVFKGNGGGSVVGNSCVKDGVQTTNCP